MRFSVLLLLVAACGPSIRENFLKNGLARASREMECPRDSLTLVERTQPLDEKAHEGALVGVEGCAQRVVYELNGDGWVAKPTRGQH